MTTSNVWTFGEFVQVTSGAGVDLRPNWTPDSQQLLFERLEGGVRRLYQIGADGTDLTPLDLCNQPGSNATGRAAFFGLDSFAFVSDRDGRPALWRCALHQGTVVPLVQADVPCHGPALAADSAWPLLYFQQPGERISHIFSLNVEGRSTQLTEAPGIQDQPWPLPDGRRFVYHGQIDSQNGVYLQDLTPGSSPWLLSDADEGTAYVTPYPSPDGEWIAFTSARTGLSQVWVMRMDGSERQQVTDGPPHSFPAWSPDGQRLVVVRGEPTAERPSGHLYTVDVQQNERF